MEMVPQVAFPKVKRSAWVYDRNIDRCCLRGPIQVFYSFTGAHLTTRWHELWEGRLPPCSGVGTDYRRLLQSAGQGVGSPKSGFIGTDNALSARDQALGPPSRVVQP